MRILLLALLSLPAMAKHHAKLSLEAAKKIALAQVSGAIVHDELEKEHGRWIYSIEIRPTGQKGIKEVNLDADSGEVVSIENEKD